MTQPKHPGGRPPKLFTCDACGVKMGSSKVTGHKCADRTLKVQAQAAPEERKPTAFAGFANQIEQALAERGAKPTAKDVLASIPPKIAEQVTTAADLPERTIELEDF